MKQIVFTDLATNLYVAPFFTTLEFHGRPFYGTNRQMPLTILFRKNALAFAKTQFESNQINLLDDNNNLMTTITPDHVTQAQLGLYLAKVTLRPLPKLTERYILSLTLRTTDEQQLQLLSGETQALPQVITWLNDHQVKLDDPMSLATKVDFSTTIDFKTFSILSNRTEFSQTLEIKPIL